MSRNSYLTSTKKTKEKFDYKNLSQGFIVLTLIFKRKDKPDYILKSDLERPMIPSYFFKSNITIQ